MKQERYDCMRNLGGEVVGMEGRCSAFFQPDFNVLTANDYIILPFSKWYRGVETGGGGGSRGTDPGFS